MADHAGHELHVGLGIRRPAAVGLGLSGRREDGRGRVAARRDGDCEQRSSHSRWRGSHRTQPGSRPVLLLGVAGELGTIEVHLAKVALAVADRLVVEMRETRDRRSLRRQ